MNHLSVKIAVWASFAYALIAILYNLSNGLIVLAVGPVSELYISPLWKLKDLLVSSSVMVAVLVGVSASITALVRHREARLVAFITLTLSCVGLSQRMVDISQFLSGLIHRS